MACFKQCYAPLGENKRCNRTTITKDNIHCSQHYKLSRKLYNKYKIACDQANILDLDEVKSIDFHQEKIKYLMKCYAILQNAYNLRMKFKIKYITPGYSDSGHEHQFVTIKKSIDICEERLQNLYQEISLPEKEVEIEPEQEKEAETSFIEEVKIFKKKRSDDEAKLNRDIVMYLKENKQYLKEKKEAIDFIISFLEQFKTLDNKHINSHMIVMISLINIVNNYNYRLIKGEYPYFTLRELPLAGFRPINIELNERDPAFMFNIRDTIKRAETTITQILKNLRITWEKKVFDPEVSSGYISLTEEDGFFIHIAKSSSYL